MSNAADRYKRTKELFMQLIARPVDERSGYLTEHCSDLKVRHSVLEMLECHNTDPLATGASCADDESLASGKILYKQLPVPDNYRRVCELKTGGMGVVFLAEQLTASNRTVALKYIAQDVSWSKKFRASFQREIASLAMLKHENVAQIIEGGFVDDTPFFSMEYVEKGKPISTFCNDDGLGIRERLRLFLQLCSAVQHAHTNLVVHRDLKPANVLVTPSGRVKLIDFGLAASEESENGVVDGTIGYASPEQASGVATNDNRTDVFSLGSIFRELFVGANYLGREAHEIRNFDDLRNFFERDGHRFAASDLLLEIHQQSKKHEALRRSCGANYLERFIVSDFLWIVRRSLETNPTDRYTNVDEFARDVRNLLEGKPVDARLVEKRGISAAVYKTKKLVARNRIISVLVAIGGVLAIGWVEQLRRTNNQIGLRLVEANAATLRERDLKLDAEQSRDNAESGFRILAGVFANLDIRSPPESHSEWCAAFAQDISSAAEALDESIFDNSQSYGMMLGEFSGILIGLRDGKNSVRLSRKVVDLFNAHPDASEGDRTRALYSLGMAHVTAWEHETAVTVFTDCLERMRQQFPERLDTLRCQSNLAVALLYSGKPKMAYDHLTEVIPRLKEKIGETDNETLAALSILGDCERQLGNIAGAIDRFEEILSIQSEHYGDISFGSIVSSINYAKCLLDAGRYGQARSVLLEVVPRAQKHLGKRNPLTITGTNCLAKALTHFGEDLKAVEFLEKVEFDRESSEQPASAVRSLGILGYLYSRLGRHEEAIEAAEQALAATDIGMKKIEVLSAQNNLALVLSAAGEFSRSIELLEKVINEASEVLEENDSELASVKANLAFAFDNAGRVGEAVELYKQMLEPDAVHLSVPTHLAATNNYVKLLVGTGQNREAVEVQRDLLARLNRESGEGSLIVDTASLRLATALVRTAEYEKAAKLCDPLLSLSTIQLEAKGPEFVLALSFLGHSYFEAKQFGRSIPIFEKIFEIHERQTGGDKTAAIKAQANLASNYLNGGRAIDAVPLLEELQSESSVVNNQIAWPNSAWICNALCEAYLNSNMGQKASDLVVVRLKPLRAKYRDDVENLAYVLGAEAKRLTSSGGYEQADEFLKEAIDLCLERKPGYWRKNYCTVLLGRNQHMHAMSLSDAENAAKEELLIEAEKNLVQGYAALKSRTDLPFPSESKQKMLTVVVEHILDLYSATGQAGEEAKWRSTLQELQRIE